MYDFRDLRRKIGIWGLRLLLLMLLLGVWAYATGPGDVSEVLLPSIGRVSASFGALTTSYITWKNAGITMFEIAAAFGIASAVGVGVGFVFGRFRTSGQVVGTLSAWGYMFPTVLLYPLFILWFGVDIPSKIAFGAVSSVFPITFNTVRGIQSVDKTYLTLGRAFRASHSMVDLHIKLGAAYPMILSGLRLGIGLTSVSVIIAELLGAYRGLGHSIQSYLDELDVSAMYAAIILLFILTFVLQGVMEKMLAARH